MTQYHSAVFLQSSWSSSCKGMSVIINLPFSLFGFTWEASFTQPSWHWSSSVESKRTCLNKHVLIASGLTQVMLAHDFQPTQINSFNNSWMRQIPQGVVQPAWPHLCVSCSLHASLICTTSPLLYLPDLCLFPARYFTTCFPSWRTCPSLSHLMCFWE